MGLWRGLERFSSAAYDLPQQMREVLDDLHLGRLTVRASDPALPATVDRLGRRVFVGLSVAAFLLSGTTLVTSGSHDTAGMVLLASASC